MERESDFAYLRRVYGPRCAHCQQPLDFRKPQRVDDRHRAICEDCVRPKARTVGDSEQTASEFKETAR